MNMIRYLVVKDDWSQPEVIEADSRLSKASVAEKHTAAKPGVCFKVIDLVVPYNPCIIDVDGKSHRIQP